MGWWRRFWELIELVLWTQPAAIHGLPDTRATGAAIAAIIERDCRCPHAPVSDEYPHERLARNPWCPVHGNAVALDEERRGL